MLTKNKTELRPQWRPFLVEKWSKAYILQLFSMPPHVHPLIPRDHFFLIPYNLNNIYSDFLPPPNKLALYQNGGHFWSKIGQRPLIFSLFSLKPLSWGEND